MTRYAKPDEKAVWEPQVFGDNLDSKEYIFVNQFLNEVEAPVAEPPPSVTLTFDGGVNAPETWETRLAEARKKQAQNRNRAGETDAALENLGLGFVPRGQASRIFSDKLDESRASGDMGGMGGGASPIPREAGTGPGASPGKDLSGCDGDKNVVYGRRPRSAAVWKSATAPG